ncbi:unnamed protein product [Merluccius merluccius]
MWSYSGGTTETSRRSSGNSRNLVPGGSYLHLPGVLYFRSPPVPPEYFSPTRGTGSEPLPPAVRKLLLPVAAPPDPPAAELVAPRRDVDTRCDGDQMRVRVRRSVLGSGGSVASQLSLGTCRPTGSTGEWVYFEIGLHECRTVRTMINNQLVYRNVLRYDPLGPPGPIRRAVPITLPVSCHYDRWERQPPWDPYLLGRSMFFEVRARSLAPHRRLYVQHCHATMGPSPTSTPKLTIVDNFGYFYPLSFTNLNMLKIRLKSYSL